jgi:HAD superfamily hydrolase (TIGR01509 family)
LVKAIIFDFGGTLDTNGIHWSEFFWDVYKKFNVNVSKEDYEKAYVEGENDFTTLSARHKDGRSSTFKGGFMDVLKQQLSNQFKHLHLSDSKLIEKMADYCYNAVTPNLRNAKETLASLKRDFRLGLISNFYGNMTSVCKEFGIDKFLDVVIDSAVAGITKPNPEIFKLAMKDLNLNAADCMMVGDSYSRDIAPAKSVGFATVWLRGRSWNEPEDSSKADFVINSLEEIKKIVN